MIHSKYIKDTFRIHDTQDTFSIHVGYIGIHSRIRNYVCAISSLETLDARGSALGRRLGRLLSCLRCLGRCLRFHSSHSSSLASLLLLGWLVGGSFRRCPVAIAVAATALASAFGMAMTKQKMEELQELQGAEEDPLQHKEHMGGLIIGALHAR